MSDLQLLTLQIVEGRISVEQARQLVIAKARMLRECKKIAGQQQVARRRRRQERVA